MAVPSLLELAVDGTSVALRFSEALSAILPSINRFSVLVNGVRVNASSTAATLSNGGTTIRFTLTTAVATGASVTITYARVIGADKAGFGDIRSLATNQRATFFRAAATTNLSGTTTPTLAITSASAALRSGESTTITFSFSRDPGTSFSNSDISLDGGTLSTITGSGLTRTATFTPRAGSSGIASISVVASSYTDVFENPGAAGTSPVLTYDTLAPTLAITSSTSALKAQQTARLTFTFTEAPIGFTADDISTTGGTITRLARTTNPKVYTATFTPTASSNGTASISVAAGSYTDAAGNAGGAGASFPLTNGTRIAVDLSAIAAGTGGFVINGQDAFDNSSRSVAAAGDVNGDGLADLIVGADFSTPAAGTDAGRSYVVFGKSTTAVIDLSAIAAGNGGFVINGQAAFDNSGTSVASAGDVNGDGLADLIVGAFLSDPATGSGAGRS
jgi:hypothetical protein